jgi:lipid-binding SYLF domain-containing protein
MMFNKLFYSIFIVAIITLLSGCETTGSKMAPARAEINRDVYQAYNDLLAKHKSARLLAANAKGVLVFPNIVKAGLMVGAQFGRSGALIVNGQISRYYNSTAASYGLQAGVQSFGYALFFMDQDALNYLDNSSGWEIGVGPSIVIVDAGVAKTLTTTTAKDNVYAYIFNQKGLMAGLGLQGSKITRITPGS